jgi:hypothetical protein
MRMADEPEKLKNPTSPVIEDVQELLKLAPGSVVRISVLPNEVSSHNLAAREDRLFPILLARAEQHWREFQPTLVKKLEAENRLQRALEEAVERTLLTMHQLESYELNPDQARELAYPIWMLPDENADEEP